jgi:hypothetical protein
MKKKAQNIKRKRSGKRGPDAAREAGTTGQAAEAGRRIDPGIVSHVRMVTSQIQGRSVSREETAEMLERVVRQHSMDYKEWIADILRSRPKKEEKGPP